MRSTNSKVIRAVHGLMSRLMNLFPTEPTNSPVASKYEELAQLYASVGTVIQVRAVFSSILYFLL